MRDINFYMEEAKTRAHIKSNRKLSVFLGLSPIAACNWKTKRAYPSDETMIRLAEVSGQSPFIALLELNIWRSTGKVKESYEKLYKGMSKTIHTLGIVGLLVAGVFAGPAYASTSINQHQQYDQYILSHLRRLRRFFLEMAFPLILLAFGDSLMVIQPLIV